MEKTHFEADHRIRQKDPDLPFIMISKPDYRQNQWDRRSIVMEPYQRALAEGDRNVYFLDGAAFFTGDEREACTADAPTLTTWSCTAWHRVWCIFCDGSSMAVVGTDRKKN